MDPISMMIQYKQTANIELRNELIIYYSYIAKTVAIQLRGISSNYAQIEDIVNQGIITLIDCVEKFEIGKGVKFESYAFMRVRGSIIDFVRKQDWLPRRVRKTAKEIAQAYDELTGEYLREPSSKELASKMNMTEADLSRHYSEISKSYMISFEGIIEGESSQDFYNEEENPENSLLKQELRKTLVESIDELSEKERLVVSLYYYEHLKLNEISKILSVSESRVCQIHSKAIGKLRVKLNRYMKG